MSKSRSPLLTTLYASWLILLSWCRFFKQQRTAKEIIEAVNCLEIQHYPTTSTVTHGDTIAWPLYRRWHPLTEEVERISYHDSLTCYTIPPTCTSVEALRDTLVAQGKMPDVWEQRYVIDTSSRNTADKDAMRLYWPYNDLRFPLITRIHASAISLTNPATNEMLSEKQSLENASEYMQIVYKVASVYGYLQQGSLLLSTTSYKDNASEIEKHLWYQNKDCKNPNCHRTQPLDASSMHFIQENPLLKNRYVVLLDEDWFVTATNKKVSQALRDLSCKDRVAACDEVLAIIRSTIEWLEKQLQALLDKRKDWCAYFEDLDDTRLQEVLERLQEMQNRYEQLRAKECQIVSNSKEVDPEGCYEQQGNVLSPKEDCWTVLYSIFNTMSTLVASWESQSTIDIWALLESNPSGMYRIRITGQWFKQVFTISKP